MVPKVHLFAGLSAFAVATRVSAETHTIIFENKCGFGTPILKFPDGPTLSTGAAFTINGPLVGAIAFLQTGSCGVNGEGCTVVDITLQNPTSPGNGSAADVNLFPPHQFSVTTGFGYFNGCDGAGQDCTSPNCPLSPLPHPGPVSVECQTNDVNLVITFCD